MSKMIQILPMAAPRVILVAFEGAQGLDVFGPAESFGAVGRSVPCDGGGYEVLLAASRAGSLRATSGIALTARALPRLRPRPSDTVLVVGGDDRAIRAAVGDPALVAWLARAAPRVRRIGSVCSGAFVLARAGILDGRRAATHWSACAELARYRPAVTVDRDAIFVRDGRVWTSAGVTTGIDMALAIIEEDHGRRVADAVAARLVLYARRPGFQSQFSDALVAQRAASDPLGPLVSWARANLRGPLDVERLARHAGLSVRTLHRRCTGELGLTPRRLGTKTIAARCGFSGAPGMARAFAGELGLSPRDYRLMCAGRS
jgi:transcriptional regulator GlxA family with amidase domain